MDLIIPPIKEIVYVGFAKILDKECVIGTDGRWFYYGPFASPNLAYLGGLNMDSSSTKDEFEKLNNTKIYDKNLVEECKLLLKEYEDKCEIVDGEYFSITETPAFGKVKFVVTKQVLELKEYIEDNK